MPFSQSFTGKDLTAKFPTEGIQKAQQNLSDIIQRVAEIKYKTREERRKEFMEMANIDPVFVLSDMARAEQTKQINLFNNEWGKKLQESGGELSDQDLMNMQSHKNLIITNAQNSLAENKRYEQMRALVQAHPEEYDLEEFKLAETQMMLDKDGKFPLMLPPIKSISPTGAIANYADKWGGVGAAQGVTYGNKTGISTQPFNPKDPNSVYTFFKSLYPKLSYQEQLGMVKDWNAKAPKEEYLKRADENNDGVYDENEKQNAIILWASENKEYIDAALAAGRKLRNVTNVKTTTGTGTSGYNKKLPISDTNNDNAKYDMQGQTNLPTEEGTASLPDFMPISVKNATPIFLTIPEVYKFDEQGRTSIKKFKEAQSVSVEVLGYSPSRDMLIVKTTSSGTGDDAVFKDSQLALDASRYDKYLQSTFGLWRGGLKGRRTTQGTYVTPEAGNREKGNVKLYNFNK